MKTLLLLTTAGVIGYLIYRRVNKEMRDINAGINWDIGNSGWYKITTTDWTN